MRSHSIVFFCLVLLLLLRRFYIRASVMTSRLPVDACWRYERTTSEWHLLPFRCRRGRRVKRGGPYRVVLTASSRYLSALFRGDLTALADSVTLPELTNIRARGGLSVFLQRQLRFWSSRRACFVCFWSSRKACSVCFWRTFTCRSYRARSAHPCQPQVPTVAGESVHASVAPLPTADALDVGAPSDVQ